MSELWMCESKDNGIRVSREEVCWHPPYYIIGQPNVNHPTLLLLAQYNSHIFY